jgi:uncharacterized surface protein with fasciclin (FAS1) repeats
MKLKNLTLSILAVILLVSASCGSDSDETESNGGILDVAREAGSFSTLVTAIEAAGLTDTLSGPGPYTVFAPSDAAFAALPAGTVQSLLEPQNKGKLTDILTYHVVAGKLESPQVVASDMLPTAFGQALRVDAAGNPMVGNTISMASITQVDIPADNGVIHVIDNVLLPMDIVDLADSAGTFTTLLAAAQAAGLEDVLRGDGPLTVFAPTDDAFDNLPEGTVASLLEPENLDDLAAILSYHVAPGEIQSTDLAGVSMLEMASGDTASISVNGAGAMIDDANIVAADLMASNGIVHVIDEVILPSM